MQAIILAAGMGKRLGNLTKNNTKCMIRVGEQTLIERALHQLDSLRLSRIILVVGYKAAELREYISTLKVNTPIIYVENSIYDKTNNIYSLYLAKDYLCEQDTLLLESDIIIEDAVLKRIVEHPYPDLAVIDKYESWMDGTVVTIDNKNRIQRFIPSSRFRYEDIPDYYKTVNIYKFSKTFAVNMYVPFLEAYSIALGNNEYYEQVLRVITMLDHSTLRALPLEGEKWYEIDDIQDLDIAESIFNDNSYDLLASRYGGYWRYPYLLDFCYLVNPLFPCKRLTDEIDAVFGKLLTEYPSGRRINELLAAKDFNISEQYITVGNGAAELINALSKQMQGKVGIIRPTFEEYPNRLNKEQIIVYRSDRADFSYTADDLMTFYADKQLQWLVVINPDNPSGNYIPYIDCLRLAKWCKNNKINLILDESFIDFSAEHPTFISNDILKEYKNLVVVKSISKSYGVPGLRLGLLATANDTLLNCIRGEESIWNINSFAEFFLQILGKYEKDYLVAMEQFRQERDKMIQELKQISFLEVIPTQANYVLCRVLPPYTARNIAISLIKKHSILIKDCSNKCGGEYIRLAIRDSKDNETLLNSLRAL